MCDTNEYMDIERVKINASRRDINRTTHSRVHCTDALVPSCVFIYRVSRIKLSVHTMELLPSEPSARF